MSLDDIQGDRPMMMNHDSKMSGGGIETLIARPFDPDTKVFAKVIQGNHTRDVAVVTKNKDWNGGSVCYVRGTNSAAYNGGHLLTPDDPSSWFSGSAFMRLSLSHFGFSLMNQKKSVDVPDPINCISRNDNAFWFSGFVPNQTVEQYFHFPQGAPIITGWETDLKNGMASYRFPKAFFEECRIFVEQNEGIISCAEIPRRYKTQRRIQITGLSASRVRIYPPESVSKSDIQVFLNTDYPFKEGKIEPVLGDPSLGYYFELENITGQLVVAW